MDVMGNNAAKGTPLVMGHCNNNAPNQQFTFSAGGFGAIKWLGNTRCINYRGRGTEIKMWGCVPHKNQRFLMPTAQIFTVHQGIDTVVGCRDLCVADDDCNGISYLYSTGQCEVWTHAIASGQEQTDAVCLKRMLPTTSTSTSTTMTMTVSTQRGIPPATGALQWALFGEQCINVSPRGNGMNGDSIKMYDCRIDQTVKQTFDVRTAVAAPIQWTANPSKCLDVRGGRPIDNTRIWLWDCRPSADSQQFLVEAGTSKQIKWAAHPDFCVAVYGNRWKNGNNVVLFRCNAAGTLRGRMQSFTFYEGTPPLVSRRRRRRGWWWS